MAAVKQKDDRIKLMDVLRGFALLGILVVNIFVFHCSFAHYGQIYGSMDGAEKSIVEAMIFLFSGKYMFLFGCLYGWSAFFFFEKYQERFSAMWRRRMLALLGFGVFHVVVLWWGDILVPYALLGLALPMFFRWSGTSLWAAALILYFLPGALEMLQLPVYGWIPLPEWDGMKSIYQSGNYWEQLQLRLKEWMWFVPAHALYFVPKQLSAMLIGIWVARTRWIRKESSVPLVALTIFSAIALLWGWFRYDIYELFDLDEQPLLRFALIDLNAAFEIGMGLALAMWVVWLFRRSSGFAGWSILAKMGRMSLTVYLSQSVLAGLWMYGFGYYGILLPSHLILGTAVIHIVIAMGCVVYFKYYKRGPLETLWRRMYL